MGVDVSPRHPRKPRYLRILLSDRLSVVLAMWLVVVPLAVRLSKGPMPPPVTGLVVIVMAALAGGLWWRLLAVGGLASRGVTMMARIIDVDWRMALLGSGSLRENIPNYAHVTVRYVFNGREYNVGRDIQGIAATTIKPGADVEVRIDPARPDRFVFANLS